jgi:hypothetical protein
MQTSNEFANEHKVRHPGEGIQLLVVHTDDAIPMGHLSSFLSESTHEMGWGSGSTTAGWAAGDSTRIWGVE